MRSIHFWLFSLTLSVTAISNIHARQALNHVDSICSTWGRDHFKTFDGDMYQFSGLCSYNLVSDCHETYQEFSVHIQRNKVDGNPKVNEVVVTINDLVFHLTKSGVTLNNDAIKLPYYNGGVQLERNAVYTKLQAKVGLVVMWNGDDAVMPICDKMIHSEAWSACASLVNVAQYAKACVQDMCGCGNTTDDFCICSTLAEFSRQCSHAGGQPPNWRTPEFCGLCGNYNMVLADDMRLRRGSWKAPHPRLGTPGRPAPPAQTGKSGWENPCSLSVENHKYTRGCPESQIFSYKLQRCQWTCKQLNSEQQSCTSDFLPVDGCSCAEGMYLDDKGVCVPMAKCPCYHSGVHI
ncbi:hypothetical protein CRUP_016613, partial [Coryphaenoides rupestris]